jgi:uncharacterized protein YjbI with pentapeptide repeats
MSKVKLQIKSILGKILFEYEKENNTIKETVVEFLKENAGKIIREANLSDMDLSGVSFYNSRFYNSRFDNSRFYNSSFDNSRFDNSSFYNSRFYNSRFDNSSFYNSRFDNSSFDNSRFDNSRFDNSSFDNSRFYNSRFDNSGFYNSRFDNSRFYNSRFDNSSFYNSSFDNSRFDNSRFDNSRFYNSSFDNSRFDNSRFDNSSFDSVSAESALKTGALESVKNDFFGRMLRQKNEVPFLKQAIIDGKINGSQYEGDCCCFVGTIAKAAHCNYKELPKLKPDSDSPTEKWFMALRPGYTPANNSVAKITFDWIEEFESYIK